MNEKINRILRDPYLRTAVVGAVCFGIGYWLGKRDRTIARTIPVPDHPFIKETLTDRIEDEKGNTVVLVEETREFTVEEAEEELGVLPVDEQGSMAIISAMREDDWDWEAEMAQRTDLEPYILTKDEFYVEENAENGYTQTTLTYYAGDDIMTDQDDKPVYNYQTITGPLRFGHGSDDQHVLYVRNDVRKAEYEILYEPGLYSVMVLGLDYEEEPNNLKHSFRMRPED